MSRAVVARYGLFRLVGEFATDDAALRRGHRCVVRTPRGTEVADVLLPAREAAPDAPLVGAVLRRATREDLARLRELEDEVAASDLALARRLARERKLEMKVVAAEHLFGGERIVYWFRAASRVELRPFLATLEAELGARVELRQLGAREELRLLGDVGHCGQPQCERAFVRWLEPVTMAMALAQREALDPDRIVNQCGVLIQCLRYEEPAYRKAPRAEEIAAARPIAEEDRETTERPEETEP